MSASLHSQRVLLHESWKSTYIWSFSRLTSCAKTCEEMLSFPNEGS